MKQFVLLLSFFCFWNVCSQNNATPEVYLIDNQYLISSAWAGVGSAFKFRGIAATRWTDVDNAPSTYTATLSGRFTEKSGFGLILSNDVNGYTVTNSITVSYSYHLTLSEEREEYLSFGLSSRASIFSIDSFKFNDAEGDPVIGSKKVIHELNFDTGFLYRNRRFFANLNISDIIKRIDEFSDREPLSIATISVYSGYEFIPKNDLSVIPSFRYQIFAGDKRSELDMNIKIKKEINETNYWAASVLKMQTESGIDALSFTPIIGVQHKNIYASYGYQIAVNSLQTGLNQNLHMFSLGFDFFNRIGDYYGEVKVLY